MLATVVLLWLIVHCIWLARPICSNPFEGCRHSQQFDNTLTWHDLTGDWRCAPEWLFSCPSQR